MFDLSGNLKLSIHGGGDSDGLAGMLESLLAGIQTLISLPAADILPTMLPGIAAMQNWHPLFVHFPIAFLCGFFAIDGSAALFRKPEWRQAASWFLYLGTVFAGFTLIAGFLAADSVVHGEDVHEIMETHEHLGISIFLLALVLSIWRRVALIKLQGVANGLYLFFAALLCVLLIFAADLGGLMVYKHGVAVAAVPTALPTELDNHEEHHHSHDHSH